jgi:hypothetical protein
MISFVCWKWEAAGHRRLFSSHHVNVLCSMIARHYSRPHRFICITDDARGLCSGIEHVPMPATGFEHLPNPSAKRQKQLPSCYRRLWNFSADARAVLGDRIFATDIDVVVTDSLEPLVERAGSFVGWCDPRFMWGKVAGGAYMLSTGAHCDIWTGFDPERSPQIAKAAGNEGSDQAWMSHKLFPPPASWSSRDGVVKINWLKPRKPLAAGTRLVFTNGECPPWSEGAQRAYPWILEHWR